MSNFQLFRNSVRATPSSGGGTQSDELQAKIKSVTSSTTVGAVFVYDTRNDSDSGAWRKKCQGLSWFDETLNTATRGGRREFPSVALLVLDEESAEETLTIYDLDDPSAPMWMQFLDAGALKWSTTSPRSFNAVTAINGRIYVGFQDGLVEFDFANDHTKIGFSGPRYLTSGTAIADRNVTATFATGGDGYTIANIVVNDVAATIVEGSELGALGLPIPTVAVATNGGVSVIHPNGSVYDITNSSGDAYEFTKKLSIDGNILAFVMDATGTPARDGWWFDLRTLYSDTTVNSGTNAGGIGSFSKTGESGDIIFVGDNVSALAKDAVGTEAGLSVYKRNDGNPEESAVAYITSDYNTGYMLGDIRLAALANANSGDRSVKGNTLTVNNTSGSDYVQEVAVATNAELKAYSNFKAANYLSRASDTDFDFGTGDFSISLWVKNTDWTGDQRLLGRSESTTARRLSLAASGTTISLYLRDGGSDATVSADVLKNNVWQHVVAFRRSSKNYLYVDGRSVATPVASTTSVTPTSAAALVIGAETFDNLSSISNPLTNGSLSLVRISATAPSPTQVADIYRQEAPLFRSGAKCLLQSDGGSPNLINDLSYDNSTELLNVYQQGTNVGESRFRGLEMVETYGGKSNGWDSSTTALGSTAAGVKASVRTGGTGGVLVDLPPFDVRGDTNIADSKSSNDGKLHFSGVTPNATPVVIGNIPIAIGEKVTVKARVQASVYNITSLNGYYEEVTATFQRPYDTGTVAVHTSFSNPTHSLSDTTLAGLDVELNANDTAKTCEVKVTGSASYRMQWNATVEVQRISEKTYER